MDMTFVCRTQPYNPKIVGTQQVVLYAMSFFYHYSMQTACLHPKGVEQVARFRPARLLRILEGCVSDVWSYGRIIHQAFSMYDGESQKEGESTCRPGAGSSQTEWHGVPEGGGVFRYTNMKNILS